MSLTGTTIDLSALNQLIETAFEEDLASGDITTIAIITEDDEASAIWIAKESGVIAGLDIALKVFSKLDDKIEWNPKKSDGDLVKNGEAIVEFKTGLKSILTGERIALNFVQRMSGIATAAHLFAEKLSGTKTKILDTRKTLPGHRMLDKYAVKIGGGENHRIGLFDMVMIKDNHIKAAGSITNAVTKIRNKYGSKYLVEIETTNIEQVHEALSAGCDFIMLDNMSIETIKTAVELIDGKVKVEASGNMNIERIREVAETGVDYISVGALTHSVKALDISQQIL
ncbi:MAG: carboxylating nicotinate-nucleotide diphosphorylase [Melioribacteraceae bacterium]|nr:carboxylating nicotinate-nucleotide diphosphorylase [Melioribacteraceae bacterium]MCF8356466.1 carboxylating nicotinate-nucleotide diphosphorylase [Melioribacteraceae bacterium]MCF8395854.1 carboxylating nicotinate-nucleotide diphosphorylase [Melioribacteraceae bacterium]MCF8420938.1 carboxylating nicotinate-nucleotide diphosphorylase [Melioribacteraceae bacterium]